MLRLTSLLGLFVFLALAWVLSNNRRRIPWRAIAGGLALMLAFALFILNTTVGRHVFDGAKSVVDQLNNFSGEGAKMAFGPLAKPDELEKSFGAGGNNFIFAISISATIILISALSALLYHWGILQRVVKSMAWVMQRAMGTSGSESLAAASNIFLGQTEAALLIRPYIPSMTRSEIMALMTAGMATIATGVMAVYGSAAIGIDAGHLLTASVLSAPAALLISKIMLPETKESETAATHSASIESNTTNSIDALCRGASEGVSLAINVIGMLIAFVAFVALANFVLGWAQRKCGVAVPVTFQNILGWANWPFAWLMGVPVKDCGVVGQALGERIVLNEFFGYLDIAKQKAALDPRSFTLATYALCGFANFSSIAIQIGGIGILAPDRRADLARLGLRAMIAGLLACYLTATVVGILID